jgi:hypothetical protein
MSRYKVLCTAGAVMITACVATAQTTVTNLFQNINKAIPDGQTTGLNDTENLTFSGPGLTSITAPRLSLKIANYGMWSPAFNGDQLTGTWAPDGGYVDPESVANTDSQTSLLSSFNGTNPNGTWTLFLADLDFGAQGTLVKWGVVITSVPEPSTWTLISLGGFALGLRLLRRRAAR